MSLLDHHIGRLQQASVEFRRQLQWLLHNQTTEAVLARGFAILAVVTLVTSWFSNTFYFPDEHYQILEFMSYKLGITSAADLPWEFHDRARPFFQPFLYFLIAKPLIAAGIRDLFTVTFVLRLVTGIVSLIALWMFAKLLINDLDRPEESRAYARILPFMGFLPYLFVRTASETATAAFFTIGLVLAVQAPRSGSLRRMTIAGLFCGLAFEFRYQSALLSLGLFLWLAIVARVKTKSLAAFVAGGIAVLAAGAVIDLWGYGVWCFPPWTYFYVNLIQGVSFNKFGSSPFYAYLYLLPGTIFAPITIVLEIALLVACLRNPRHYIIWATIPFALVHCFLAHKEERFFFPLAILATAYPVMAFAPGRPFDFFDRFWAWRRSTAAKAVGWSAVAAMLFLTVYPFGIRPHLKMAQYLYHHFPHGLTASTFNQEPFTSYPMNRPPHFRSERLRSDAELKILLARGPVYLFSETPAPPALPANAHATLLYSEFPFYGSARITGWAMQAMCDVADLKRTTPIHPPQLTWMTLFKVERGAPTEANVPSLPCKLE